MAGLKDYTIEQGATFTDTITWSISGSGVNLTGYDVRMQVRQTYADLDSVIILSASIDESNIVLANQATYPGQFTITIPASVTELLEWEGAAKYDIEVESANGTVTRLLQGQIRLSREVTRPSV
jgi:hypothetical protein